MEKESISDQKTSSTAEAINEDSESANNQDDADTSGSGPTEKQVRVDSVVMKMVVNREGRTDVYVQPEELGEGEPMAASDEVNVLRVQIRVLKHSSTSSKNPLNYFPKALVLIFTILGWLLCCAGLPFVSITMIIIGSIFIGDCNIQPKIPLYLVIGGTCGAARHLLALWITCLPNSSLRHRRKFREFLSVVNCTMMLFQLVWFICGCVWVYGVKDVNFEDSLNEHHCHKTVYYFTFWLLSLYLLFVAIVVMTILLFCCIFCIVSATN